MMTYNEKASHKLQIDICLPQLLPEGISLVCFLESFSQCLIDSYATLSYLSFMKIK